MRKLVGQVGNWVVGDQFWNREEESAYLTELLDEGRHVLLVAQRRVGKTSLMREVSRQIEDRYTCLHIDLENCQSPGDAIVELSLATLPHIGLWNRTREIFGNIFGQAKDSIDSVGVDELTIKLRSGVAGEWRVKGDRLIDALGKADEPVVLFIDELPILVNRLLKGGDFTITPERRQATDAFVSWLRSVTMLEDNTLRLVVTGSIGLEPVLRQAGLSATINTLTPFELNPWDGETAMGCLRALANNKGVEFDQSALEQVVELLGSCIPHHVQMFFSKLYEDCRRRKTASCTVEDVQRVYETHMLSSRGHVELSHMEERLKLVCDQADLPLVFDLLTEAAVTGELTAQDAMILAQDHGFKGNDAMEVLKNALYIFEHDGYLHKRDDRFTFVSKLLRAWWKAHHGFFYTPAHERSPKENTT